MIDHVKIIIIAIALSTAAFGGWYVEHLRFEAFKTEVRAEGEKQTSLPRQDLDRCE